jgi:hypothetical protein
MFFFLVNLYRFSQFTVALKLAGKIEGREILRILKTDIAKQ